MCATKSLSVLPPYGGALISFIIFSSASLNAGVDGFEPVFAEPDIFIPGMDALCWAFAGSAAMVNAAPAQIDATRMAKGIFIFNLRLEGGIGDNLHRNLLRGSSYMSGARL